MNLIPIPNCKNYLSLYDSLLQGTLLSLNIPLFEKHYQQFLAIETFGADEKNYKLSLDLYLQSIYAIVSKKTALIPELTKRFYDIKDESYIPNYRKISIGYYMIFGTFLNEDYDTTQAFILWLKNHKHLGVRHDIEIAALTMECIILIKKEAYDLLEYKLRAFYEFLKNRERKFLMEDALMRLLKKILNHKGKKDLRKVMEESLAEMRQIIKDNPNEQAFLNAFDVSSWLESELEQESFKIVYYRNNIS